MPDYSSNLGLYLPDRNDSSVFLDESLSQNFLDIDNLIGSALKKGSTVYNDLKSRFEEIESQIVNISGVNLKGFGAVADGVTDDTPALQDAVDYIHSIGGGTIHIPHGIYLINGRVELKGNITFVAERGTVIKKDANSSTPHVFVIGMKHGTTGYGGGGKNFGFYNITFQGRAVSDTDYNALANTFNHAENVIFKNCKFIDCITTAHAVDLCGCNNVHFFRCIFSGAYQIAGREYTEAVQIDSSTEGALGDPAFTNYDSLPTKNVSMVECLFVPSYNEDGSIKNYAPNPIGNHGFTGGMHYENIFFSKNIVVDGWAQNGNWRAWIHFYGLMNGKFHDNVYINNHGGVCAPYGFYSSDAGRYDPVTGESGTGEPLPCRDVEIVGDRFYGFNAVGNPALIRAYGTTYNSTDYRVVNYKIHDNQFSDCGDPAMVDGEGTNLIQINKYTDVSIRGNKADLAGRMASIYDGDRLTIGVNTASRLSLGMYYVSTTRGFSIAGALGSDLRRPLEVLESSNGSIIDNTFYDILQTGSDGYANKLRNLDNVIIQSNNSATLAGIQYGYYVYETDGTAGVVNIYDNMAGGFTTDVNMTGDTVNYNYRA